MTKRPVTAILIAAIAIPILMLGYYHVVGWQMGKLAAAGQLGDTFGATNSFFSGLAFVGLLIAILLQREDLKSQTEQLKLQCKELELQREELKLTRGELAKSAEAQESQYRLMVLQAQSVQISNEIQTKLAIVRLPTRAAQLIAGEGDQTVKAKAMAGQVVSAFHELDSIGKEISEKTSEPAASRVPPITHD